MSKTSYAISTANPNDKTLYGILITYRDGSTGWIVGGDGDGMFFPEKGQAAKKLREMQADDKYSWNCGAEVVEFTEWGSKG